jgi:phenylacetate-CoA ligase
MSASKNTSQIDPELPLAEPPDSADRFPICSVAGHALMQRLRTHPQAPIFRNESGHRQTAADLSAFDAFEAKTKPQCVKQYAKLEFDSAPSWLISLAQHAFAQTPHYRDLGSMPKKFSDIAPISRADLAHDVVRFVPDDIAAARIIHYSTSGTTGHKLILPSLPRIAARYRVFYERALARFDVHLSAGRGDVGLLLLGHQQRCFTYVSVVPMRAECGLVKLNLHANDWRNLADRAVYLDAIQAELYTGDPISLRELLALPTQHRPKALVSTSMSLLPALREQLERRFACPVLDLYSMNEAGPIGVFDAALAGYVLLQPELLVEILRPDGSRAELGEHGEITLSGGFNDCLPLLRYRTGDYAALNCVHGVWVLTELSGRPPVRFRSMAGNWLNNVDVTHALKVFPLAQWTLLQERDAALVLSIQPYCEQLAQDLTAALKSQFGANQKIRVRAIAQGGDKLVQYMSRLE